MTLDYEAWLKQAQDRLEALYEQRGAIDDEIAALQRGIEGFSPLVRKYAPWSQETVGITESVTQVFKDSPKQMLSPRHVRDCLLSKGIQLTQQNPLATIHQTISRLVARGVIKGYTVDGRMLYYYEGSTGESLTPSTRNRLSGPSGNNPLAGKKINK
jgi:hypothetical protein